MGRVMEPQRLLRCENISVVRKLPRQNQRAVKVSVPCMHASGTNCHVESFLPSRQNFGAGMSLAYQTGDIQRSVAPARSNARSTTAKAAHDLGLRLVTRDSLSIRRRRSGSDWTYLGENQRPIRDAATIKRLNRLAVPPAYQDVLYSKDPAGHLQAVGRDAAGRLQYRYHPEWDKVREIRKARRLERLAAVLPRIRRSLGRHLQSTECTRGAATLLKSNVELNGSAITLTFRAKGGKTIIKGVKSARLAKAVRQLAQLSGKRLFQYRSEDQTIRPITTREINAFLREIAGVNISLK